MKTHAVLLLFTLAAAAERDLEKRFFGANCKTGQRLYHVKLITTGDLLCGGSLINRRWVLTAAHCGRKKPGPITVTLGAHHEFGKTEKEVQVIPVAQQYRHPTADIQLLRLVTDAPDMYPSIRLPASGCSAPEVHRKVELAGFGGYKWDDTLKWFVPGGKPYRTFLLECGTMEIDSIQAGTFKYKAGDLRDTVPGDSGAGVEYTDHTHLPRLYGVHINGIKIAGLATGPAGATDVCVTAIRDWIRDHLTDPQYDVPHPVGDPDYNPPPPNAGR